MSDTPKPSPQDPKFDPESFKERLDSCHEWPCAYVFKFIASAGRIDLVRDLAEGLLDAPEITSRASSGGKWVSLTITANLCGADEVLAVYARMAELDGVIAL